MNEKLAIKGHSTRGKEVIELLEMMGGRNEDNMFFGKDLSYIYFIDGYGFIRKVIIENNIHTMRHWQIFTLEEFLEKYPYKVGDKIPDVWGNSCTVKSMSWDENYKTVMYGFEETIFVVRGDELYMTNIINNHTEPYKMKNVLAELLEHIKTTPKEDLEREFEEIAEWSNVGPTVEEFRTFCECVNKKPVYPDNYEECVRIAKNIHGYDIHIDAPAYRELLESFVKLLICRDAYWKIAGEEMGLGKPWKPDWTDLEYDKFCIWVDVEDIAFRSALRCQHILTFPTEEMRDAFYENFEDLIVECKELL